MTRAGHLGVLLLASALAACSSIGGSAIRTGSVHMPAYSGPVAIYSTGQPPPGAVDLGLVEVHGAQQEGTVDELLPQFVKKVATIGGDVAVVDGIRARFALVGRAHVETFYYSCGLGATCAGTRAYQVNDEIMVVSIFGRAFSTRARAPVGPEAPLTPSTTAPAPAAPAAPAPGPAPAPPAAPSSPAPARAPSPSPAPAPSLPAPSSPSPSVTPLPSQPSLPRPRGADTGGPL